MHAHKNAQTTHFWDVARGALVRSPNNLSEFQVQNAIWHTHSTCMINISSLFVNCVDAIFVAVLFFIHPHCSIRCFQLNTISVILNRFTYLTYDTIYSTFEINFETKKHTQTECFMISNWLPKHFTTFRFAWNSLTNPNVSLVEQIITVFLFQVQRFFWNSYLFLSSIMIPINF